MKLSIINIYIILYISTFFIRSNIMIKLILDQLMEEKQITRYRLAMMTEIRYQIIDNYYKNKVQRYDGYTLNRICKALDCNIEDILRYYPDEDDEP